jgi:hypothetical protein
METVENVFALNSVLAGIGHGVDQLGLNVVDDV